MQGNRLTRGLVKVERIKQTVILGISILFGIGLFGISLLNIYRYMKLDDDDENRPTASRIVTLLLVAIAIPTAAYIQYYVVHADDNLALYSFIH